MAVTACAGLSRMVRLCVSRLRSASHRELAWGARASFSQATAAVRGPKSASNSSAEA